jgi:ubiquinone/menaquinone biosynthesis C-methylase UbiE
MSLRTRVWRLVFRLRPVDTILKRRAREVIEKTGVRKHLKVGGVYLDVGSGSGHIAEALVRDHPGRSIRALAMDPVWTPTSRVIRRVRRRIGKQLLFLRGDGTRLPVGDAAVDGVLLFFVLHHVPGESQLSVLREARRVLKRDGRLVLVEDTPESPEEWEKTVRRDRRLNFESKAEGHYYRSGPEWREVLAREGWDVVEEVYFEEVSSRRGEGVTRHRCFVAGREVE